MPALTPVTSYKLEHKTSFMLRVPTLQPLVVVAHWITVFSVWDFSGSCSECALSVVCSRITAFIL
jgi:hypothetical protein